MCLASGSAAGLCHVHHHGRLTKYNIFSCSFSATIVACLLDRHDDGTCRATETRSMFVLSQLGRPGGELVTPRTPSAAERVLTPHHRQRVSEDRGLQHVWSWIRLPLVPMSSVAASGTTNPCGGRWRCRLVVACSQPTARPRALHEYANLHSRHPRRTSLWPTEYRGLLERCP